MRAQLLLVDHANAVAGFGQDRRLEEEPRPVEGRTACHRMQALSQRIGDEIATSSN